MSYEWGTITTLWRRDMLRLQRERSRWFGVILQPLVFWLIIGSGMSNSFKLSGSGANDLSYLEYTYPGIVVMVVLFTAIFATISVIEDRQSGFLQGVLVGPASRGSMVLGKLAGVTTLALMQVAVLVAMAPLAGFEYSAISWGALIAVTVLTSFGLSAVGYAMAWWLDSVQAYHALMSVGLLPLWILSGAMFPPQSNWVDWVMVANPMTYSVDATRAALGGADIRATLGSDLSGSLGVLVLFVLLTFALAVFTCRRKKA